MEGTNFKYRQDITLSLYLNYTLISYNLRATIKTVNIIRSWMLAELEQEKQETLRRMSPGNTALAVLDRYVFDYYLKREYHGKHVKIRQMLVERLFYLDPVERLPMRMDPLFREMREVDYDEELVKDIINKEKRERTNQMVRKVREGDLSVFANMSTLMIPFLVDPEESNVKNSIGIFL